MPPVTIEELRRRDLLRLDGRVFRDITLLRQSQSARLPLQVRLGLADLQLGRCGIMPQKGYQTTLVPATMQNGGPHLGPKWAKVVRRITCGMHSHKVLVDDNPKGMALEDLTAPIRNSKANGRDIITEFHFVCVGHGVHPMSTRMTFHLSAHALTPMLPRLALWPRLLSAQRTRAR